MTKTQIQSKKSDNDRADFLENFKDIFDTITNSCPHEINLQDNSKCQDTDHSYKKCLNCWRLALDLAVSNLDKNEI